MLRAPFFSRATRGLLWATGAAVALHVLGTMALSVAGWSGRGESSRSFSTRGAGSSETSSLRVRLANPAASRSDVADVPMQVAADEGQSVAVQASSLIEQAPAAAGGMSPLAALYLSSSEVDQGPVPEPGWVLDEAVLERVIFGNMRLRLWVSADGHIDRVAVLHAEPTGQWAQEAIRPLQNTRMRPAERGGRPVASTIVVELSSDLESMR